MARRRSRPAPGRAGPAPPPGAAPPGDPSPRPAGLRAAWLLAIPLGLAAAAYARVLRGEFVLDDFGSIVANPAVKDLGASLRGLGRGLVAGGRPVTDLTFALNHAAGGLDPVGYHAVNVAVHLAVVVLVFHFTREVLRLAGARSGDGMALVVAGVFALHPMQSQAVSYVVQRAESLASGLYLAALLLLLVAERAGRGWRGAAAWAGAAAALVLGMGTKAIVATMPLAYLLLAGIVPGAAVRRELASWPRRLAMLAPLAALDLLLALGTAGGIAGSEHAGFAVAGLSPASYLLTQSRAVATYLRLLVLPVGQNGYWVVAPSRSLAEPAVLASGAFLVAVLGGGVALAAWGRRREADGAAGERTSSGGDGSGGGLDGPAAARVAAFGLLWFFVVLAPTSSVVPLADLVVEHRVYLASWGVFAAATVGAGRLLQLVPADRRTLAAAAVVAVLWGVLAVALHRRNAVWETRLAFWSDAVAKAPTAQRPHLNLAYAHWDRGDFEAAIREYRLALDHGGRAAPADEAFILNNLGVALLSAGRGDEAVEALLRASSLQPRDASPLANLALAMVRRDDLAAAESYATRALALDPREGGALAVLGGVRLARGDAAGAVDPLERAVRADPDDGERWLNLGLAQQKVGRLAEACAAWRRVTRMPVPEALRRAAVDRASAAGCPGAPRPAGPATPPSPDPPASP